ncbi:predicted protein [Plenodomus lingam JN3]|uniref:Predicted protein n=1 Tax=Leptosphaeria maculans (strain JN3 / isolate v23.1.3 / race Av1-4-5-6-7-8) TaxID=985895 RepID=E4ZWI8_LEPMJ|nr:predicted protein [Plenodomus lingam JN3]CBX95964.1 predicted protein [Plenodomus lingam JN3]
MRHSSHGILFTVVDDCTNSENRKQGVSGRTHFEADPAD